LAPFLTALTALFLTVAVLPACVLRTTLLASVYASEAFVADQEEIVPGPLEPGIEFLGITVDSLAIPDDFFAPLLSKTTVTSAVSDVALDIGAAPESDSPVLSIVRRLAALSLNPGVWVAAFAPGVWSVLTWHVPRPRRRRSRRHQH
jgi:hypothetical protein